MNITKANLATRWEFSVTEESLTRQKAFFDKYLRGLRTEVEFWPRVRYTVRERYYIGEWRYANRYSLPNTQYRKLFPTASGGLSDVALPKNQQLEYDTRAGELKFDLPMLSSLEFVGRLKLRLWVKAIGSDNLDLFVTLRKNDKNGNEVHFPWLTVIGDGPIAFGYLRASRRELDELASCDSKPVHNHARDLLLQPGEIFLVGIEILPTSCRFLEGDSLSVVISGHDYHEYPPFVPVAPHKDTVNKGKHIIHFGGNYDSYLQLPIIPPVTRSVLSTARTVKWSMAAQKVKGWSTEKFIQERTINGHMTAGIAGSVPTLRNYTQLIASADHNSTSSQGQVNYDCNHVLGWSSLRAIKGLFKQPQYIVSAGRHIFTEPDFVGSLSQAYRQVKFDPVTYEARKSAVLACVYLPKSSSFSPSNLESDKDARLDSVAKNSPGTGLPRYVINRDVTPIDWKDLFDGAQFV